MMSARKKLPVLFILAVGMFFILLFAGCASEPPVQTESPQAVEEYPGPYPYPYPVVPYVYPTIDPYPEPGQKSGENPILTSNDWTPQASDQNMTRGEADIQESGILPSMADASVSALVLSGMLPTPCHKLRVVPSDPDAQGKILVEVYSVVDPAAICVQVLEPFAAEVPLPAYVQGETTVVINGEELP